MPKKTAAQLDREIAEALRGGSWSKREKTRGPKTPATRSQRRHATVATAPTTGRWIHRTVARRYDVPEDVVRRIYTAVQTAKRQDLHGGHMADLSERSVGRKLVGNEYTVYARAKEHLGYDPPGGYGGSKPRGSAKEPLRAKYDDPKIKRASELVARAESTVRNVLFRKQWEDIDWEKAKDRDLLRQAADELDVAADLYEEAGARVRAGTLRERARLARRGDYKLLAVYD